MSEKDAQPNPEQNPPDDQPEETTIETERPSATAPESNKDINKIARELEGTCTDGESGGVKGHQK